MERIKKFLNHKHVIKLLTLIDNDNDNFRFIGGCVRDLLLGKEINDIDMATKLLPSQAIEFFNDKNIHVIPTGLKHGTITIIIDDIPIEITTLRIDVNCDGRHADIEFVDDYKQDAGRRDFTINAISMDLRGNVYDYFGGIEDLNNKIVKFIGIPEERIKEDYLRILRYFRFCAYYAIGTMPNHSLIRLISGLSPKLNVISKERIKNELFKTLASPTFIEILQYMERADLFPYLNLHVKNLDHILYIQKYQECSSLMIYAILMLKNSNAEHPQYNLNFLPLSKVERNYILSLYKYIDFSAPLSSQIKTILSIDKTYLHQTIIFQAALQNTPSEKLEAYFQISKSYMNNIFPISRKDLILQNITIADLTTNYNILYDAWIESKCTLTQTQLLKMLETKVI